MTNEKSTTFSRKAVTWIVGLAGALLVGALGNGVYDFWLKGMLVSSGNWILNLYSHLWSGYVDTLHANIGTLRMDQRSKLTFTMVFTMFVSAMSLLTLVQWNLIRYVTRQREGQNVEQFSVVFTKPLSIRAIRMIGHSTILMTAFIITTLFVRVAEANYERKAIIWSEQCIEIVSPKINADERLQLRADLRSINSAQLFFKFYDQVNSIATRTNVALPEFVPIGRN